MNLRIKSGLFNSKRSLFYRARVNFQMKDVPGSRMWIWKPSLLALSFAGDGLTLALPAPCACLLSCVRLFATPWTAAHQVPLSMEFSRQEYWSGLPFPPPGDLPNPGLKLMSSASLALQADSLPLSHQGSPSFTWSIDIFNVFMYNRRSTRLGPGICVF